MEKTKVLWFSNHKISVEHSKDLELKKNSGRGWVAALEMLLRDFSSYEIAIAFPDNTVTEMKKKYPREPHFLPDTLPQSQVPTLGITFPRKA